MINSNQKIQVLTENANQAKETLKEYVITEAENDPGFFRWLFDESFEQDFDTSLSDKQRKEYLSFLESL